jgi:PadR family transcriptional regulator, regulatory protein PadR
MLGELEQLVILGVLHAGRDAYGVPVHDEIERRVDRELTLGTIYTTLSRLDDKGLVTSRIGEPTPQLQTSLKALRRMASGLDVGLEPT